MSEATPEDRVEQQTTAAGAAPRATDPVVPLEAPAPDVAEQAADVGPDAQAPGSPSELDVPLESDPADAAEQASVVDLDEDERR